MSRKQILIICALVGFIIIGALFGGLSERFNKSPVFNNLDEENLASIDDKNLFTSEIPENAELSKANIETPASADSNGSKIKIFDMTVSNNGYNPNNFTVNVGDTVQIRMTATDNDYDFYLPWHGIYQSASKGVLRLISFTATDSGTLNFECRDKCPNNKITGSVIVLP